ncbi:MAG: 2Fe-2S iron-sulfur cluster-binding protein [Steroidobacteraceae bacterium]
MPVIRVTGRNGIERSVEAQTGRKLMEVLRELDAGVAAICGGECSCATCHVYVAPDWLGVLPRVAPDERELLDGLAYATHESRLSCQIDVTPALEGMAVTIPPQE